MNSNRSTTYFYSLIIFIFIAIVSCTERINIDLDSTYTRPVIFGEITTDTTSHKVTLSKTADYFNSNPPVGISMANVRISDGENTYVLTEDVENPGVYYTSPDVFGVPGKTYTLLVDNVDLLGDGQLTSYSASSKLLPVSPIDSIRLVHRLTWQGWVVQAYAKDPPESKDYYKFLISLNDQLQTDSLSNMQITDDTFFNGSYTNGVVVYFFSERRWIINEGDKITAGFCGITKDYYNYLVEAQTASRRSAPLFSGPAANPRTNLTNGAIGYFTAYSISRATTFFKKQ
jgi:hypothetical protein